MTIFVALGSNLGDRRALLSRAVEKIRARSVAVVARSAVYRSTPVGLDTPHEFLNAAVQLSTALEPRALLELLLDVEARLGRRRGADPGDRTCDLDLLLYADRRVDEPDLQLPHPRMTSRRFVLLPLLDLAPDLRDPISGRAYSRLAADLRGDASQICERAYEPDQW